MKKFYANINYRIVFRGILSYIPYFLSFFNKGKHSKGTGGSNTARYCYAVWMRHLYYILRNSGNSYPKIIAELGPGDSLGIGLAALLTGAETYYALDIINHANPEKNLSIFDELIELFKQKEPIPDKKEFPSLEPNIADYSFPDKFFDWDYLLSHDRISNIRKAIKNVTSGNITICYKAPWYATDIIQGQKLDLIFSQAVMEHILELDKTYSGMYSSLKNNGLISHTIDLSAHEIHNIWNGHWYINNLLWKIIIHGRSYAINRKPYSFHKIMTKQKNFKILKEVLRKDNTSLKQKIPGLSKYDYNIRSAYILAKK